LAYAEDFICCAFVLWIDNLDYRLGHDLSDTMRIGVYLIGGRRQGDGGGAFRHAPGLSDPYVAKSHSQLIDDLFGKRCCPCIELLYVWKVVSGRDWIVDEADQ
jgi:hypothetical protein